MTDSASLPDLDRLVHEPGRLRIMAVLGGVDRADFVFILGQTNLSRGNLSSHMSRLEDAGYVSVAKTFVGKLPRTVYSLTPRGYRALTAYKAHMAAVLDRLP